MRQAWIVFVGMVCGYAANALVHVAMVDNVPAVTAPALDSARYFGLEWKWDGGEAVDLTASTTGAATMTPIRIDSTARTPGTATTSPGDGTWQVDPVGQIAWVSDGTHVTMIGQASTLAECPPNKVCRFGDNEITTDRGLLHEVTAQALGGAFGRDDNGLARYIRVTPDGFVRCAQD